MGLEPVILRYPGGDGRCICPLPLHASKFLWLICLLASLCLIEPSRSSTHILIGVLISVEPVSSLIRPKPRRSMCEALSLPVVLVLRGLGLWLKSSPELSFFFAGFTRTSSDRATNGVIWPRRRRLSLLMKPDVRASRKGRM